MNARNGISSSWLPFFAGLVSALYVPTPVGTIAMLDMAAYVLAVPLILTQYNTYPKCLRRLLGIGVLWVLNAALSDFWRGTPALLAFKESMILVDSLCLIVVGAWLIRKSPKALPYFLMGAAISEVISLYHFQNGAYLAVAIRNGFTGGTNMSEFLIEKQVKPLWMNMFLMAGVFGARMLFKMPWMMCIGAFFAAGFLVLFQGGSRSTFLTMVSAAGLMACYVYMPKVYDAIFKRKIVTLLCIFLAAIVFNASYMFMAKQGYLGEDGRKKQEEYARGDVSMLDSRIDFFVSWPYLKHSPLIGCGVLMQDKWGYLRGTKFAGRYLPNGRFIENTLYGGHSCIVAAWTANGIFGLVFWLYGLWLIFSFLGEKSYVLGDAAPFVVNGLLTLTWAIMFSPYGGFRGRAMFFLVFLALAQSQNFRHWMKQTGLSMVEKRKYRRELMRI